MNLDNQQKRAFEISVGALTATAAVAALVGWVWKPADKLTPQTAGEIIAITGVLAVAIERIMEVIWTFISQIHDTWWPMSGAHDDLKTTLVDAIDKAKKVVAEVTHDGDNAKALVSKATDELKKIEGEVAAGVSTSAQYSALLAKIDGAVLPMAAVGQTSLDVVGGLTNAASKFLDSFNDNPIRRLISVFAGMIMGLLATALIGLDVFQAAAATSDEKIVAANWGIVLTGILIGLGATPTHEVIKAIQEFKQKQRS